MWFALMAATAWACGGLVHSGDVLAENDTDQVLFQVGQDHVTVTYHIGYTGDAHDFGWVIPIFGTFQSLYDADPAIFDTLDQASAPEILEPPPRSGGCVVPAGCGAADRVGGGSMPSVDVVAQGFTGTYDYVVVHADSASDLDTWMSSNGWSAGTLGTAFQHYVDQGADFVALKVVPDTAQTPDGGASLPPVAITYGGTNVVYPAALLGASAVSEQKITIFLDAPWVMGIEGWHQDQTWEIDGQDGEDGTAAWERYLRADGANSTFLLTYAGPSPLSTDGRLTRYDTIAPPAAATEDASFESVADQYVSTRIVVSGNTAQDTALLLPLSLFGWSLRRRRRPA